MPARFTKAEITRAVDAAKSSGLTVTSVEIAPDGTIRLRCPTPLDNEKPKGPKPKEWSRA